VPDVSPVTNGLAWSFAIIFACWAAMQLIEVVSSLRLGGPLPPPADEPPLEEAAPAAPGAHH
jgi:hypothetical protein